MVHLEKAENALSINWCNKERNRIKNYAAKLLAWINVCNQLTLLDVCCVSWLCCKLETIGIYIYAFFIVKKCAVQAMQWDMNLHLAFHLFAA